MDSTVVIIAFQIIVILMSVVIHEVSHGVAALWLGDPTAKYADRLTLNPFKHLEWWGSFFVPLMMIWLVGIPFGWAKPVPYNPYNLRDQKKGPALVGLAGPASNILLAIAFGLGARFLAVSPSIKSGIVNHLLSGNYDSLSMMLSGSLSSIFFLLFVMIVIINVFLAFFNLIPIPPLDGSKLLFSILNLKTGTMIMLEQFGFVFLLVIVIFFRGLLGAFLISMLSLFFSVVVGM